mmetsp:Transcript_21672/g.47157  ORF Transcript_21672/g.47157 Transcript_21672/m.47157 type:complete len:128 (+) Transcript_21672:387-770(+)
MASTVFRQRLISTSATSLPLSVSALRVAGVTTPQRHATPPLHTTDRLEWLGARCEREVRYQHIKGAKLVDFTMQVHSARVGAVTRATNAVELRDDFSAIVHHLCCFAPRPTERPYNGRGRSSSDLLG